MISINEKKILKLSKRDTIIDSKIKLLINVSAFVSLAATHVIPMNKK